MGTPGGQAHPQHADPRPLPNLAVEVISEGNSVAEMPRKLQEYFDASVSLVWSVDHKTRTVVVTTSPESSTEIAEDGELEGGAVLPGFSLLVADIFRKLEP